MKILLSLLLITVLGPSAGFACQTDALSRNGFDDSMFARLSSLDDVALAAPLSDGWAKDISATRSESSEGLGTAILQQQVTDFVPESGQVFAPAIGEVPKRKTTGFLDFNYYFDTRDFNTLTINAGAKLPGDIEYFQLTNFDSPLDDPSETDDFTGFYTEIHFRRPIAKEHRWLKPLDWSLMFADGSTVSDIQRLGVRWRLHDSGGPIGDWFDEVLKLKYAVNFFFVESDGSGMQIEHAFRRSFFDKRMYVGGFADHNINNGSSSWVTETQIGLRLVDQFHVVAEYRYKSSLTGSLKSGVGLGFEYIVKFN